LLSFHFISVALNAHLHLQILPSGLQINVQASAIMASNYNRPNHVANHTWQLLKLQ